MVAIELPAAWRIFGENFRPIVDDHLPLHAGGPNLLHQQLRVDLLAVEIEIDLALAGGEQFEK